MQGRPDRAPGSASSLRFCGEWPRSRLMGEEPLLQDFLLRLDAVEATSGFGEGEDALATAGETPALLSRKRVPALKRRAKIDHPSGTEGSFPAGMAIVFPRLVRSGL